MLTFANYESQLKFNSRDLQFTQGGFLKRATQQRHADVWAETSATPAPEPREVPAATVSTVSLGLDPAKDRKLVGSSSCQPPSKYPIFMVKARKWWCKTPWLYGYLNGLGTYIYWRLGFQLICCFCIGSWKILIFAGNGTRPSLNIKISVVTVFKGHELFPERI